MAKTPKEIVITTAKPERKRTVPRSAFKKGVPNPTQFKPGESGRTRTKADARPDDERLIGRVLRRRLGDRAPDAHAKAVGLKAGASWAMVLGEALLLKASEGDVQAIREVSERSEGGRAFNLGIGMQFGGDAGEPGSEQTPLLRVVFTTPEFQNLSQETGLYSADVPALEPPILEGKLTTQSELDPDLARAREEAQRAALRIAEPEDKEEEPEAASDDEDAAVTTTEPESTLPPLPPGFEYWPKWKMRQYRMNRWKIPPNVVEM